MMVSIKNRFVITLMTVAVTCVIISCETEDIIPDPDFVIENEAGEAINTATVGVPVVFRSISENAEFDAIWPGDSTHIYGVADVPNMNQNATTEFLPGSGFVLGEDGFLTYTYSESGSYTVTLVSTTVNDGRKIITRTRERILNVEE